MMLFRGYSLVRFILIILTTLTLVLSVSNNSSAQLPGISNTNGEERINTLPWWDLNRAFPCGRFLCSNIYLQKVISLNPELVIGVPFDIDDSTLQARLQVESRARLVQKTFTTIYDLTIKSRKRRDFFIPQKQWGYWLPSFDKPLHPLTPQFEVGFQNSQTVIFVPPQSKLGIGQQDIVTVTEIDARVNGQYLEELAAIWKHNLQHSMSQRLWGYSFGVNYPGIRLIMLLAIALITFSLIWAIHYLKNILKRWDKLFNIQLDRLGQSLRGKTSEIESKTHNINPSLLLKKQTILTQKQNLIVLSLRILFWLQISILLLNFSLMSMIFIKSRFLYRLFLGQALFFPGIWWLISLGNKTIDLVTEYYINQWAQRSHSIHPMSNRYNLRAKTYSRAFRSASIFLFNLLGIYITILFFGIDFNFYANAGVVAVILAFLSRNIIENMLNGALILWYDSYAVGDVIDIEGHTGFVEDINLYATSLRNLSGELIIIPNRSINILINQTKDWSRVNFTIEINYDADNQKAMDILKQVAEQMRQDPEWSDKILESAEILGVDSVSHQGVMIRTLIKTAPLEQWAVEREFRLRVKSAFDQANIAVGVPQYKIIQNKPSSTNEFMD